MLYLKGEIELLYRWQNCRLCRLAEFAYEHVIGAGVAPCDVLFVGEAPGKTEDIIGLPFVGRSGKVLDHWIDVAKMQKRFTFAITNLLACRPTQCLGGSNRAPFLDEIIACRPRLAKLWGLCSPRVVIFLGKEASKNASYLLRRDPIPYIELPHPAYILRCGGIKSKQSADVIVRLVDFLRENLK